MAKEIKIIDTNLFSGSLEVFRTAVGGFWEVVSSSIGEEADPVYYYDSDSSEVEEPYNPFISAVYSNADLLETISEDVILPNYKFPVRVVGNADLLLSDSQWKSFWIGGTFGDNIYDPIYTEETFDNYSFDYELPYPMQEAKYILDNGSLDSIAQITCEYNHYLPKYEDYIKNLDSELLIPNMYILKLYHTYAGSAEESSGQEIPTFVQNFVTREGTVPYETAAELLSQVEEEIDTDGNLINMEDSLIYQYLTSSLVIAPLSASTATQVKNRFENIIFDNNIVGDDTYSLMGESINMMPFYIKFNFNAQKDPTVTDKFSHDIRNNDLEGKFLKTLKEIFTNEITLQPTSYEASVETSYFSGSTDLSSNTYQRESATKSYRSVDYMEMLQYMYKNYDSTTSNCYYMGTDQLHRNAAMDTSGSYRYFNSLAVIETLNNLIDHLKTNFAVDSLADLYELEASHNETLAYRIEKIGGPPTGDRQTQRVLQNFWFWNGTEFMDESTEFYDSQVKYNQIYTYNIYAYVLTLGTKYSFSDLVVSRQIGTTDAAEDVGTYCTELYDPFTDEASSQLFSDESTLAAADNTFASNAQIISFNRYIADFYANCEPSLKIVEMPVMSKTLKVMDNPPNQINVRPYQMMDASQRIGYTLQYEVFNDTANYPTTITGNDDRIKSDYLHAKDLVRSDHLDQESISKQRYIEIYRLSEKPTQITDFQNNLITTIDLRDPKSFSTKSVENFIQQVRANTKYYYLFRMLNEQLMPGQLTEIYEAQLINDGGYIYSLFNVLFEEDLEEDTFVNPAKVFKKLFQLTPNLSQMTLITDDLDYTQPAYTQLGNIGVGEADDLIWGKQFKIRLTSKKTGKKIDLNFTYNLESD